MLEWLQNPIVSIAFAIGLMFFGYFFGLFEGRGQGYKRRKEEEAEEKETEPVVEEPVPAAPAIPPDETQVLGVSRHQNGQLLLILDGERTESATLSVEQRKRLIEILTWIRPWLEAPKPARAASVPPPTPPRPAPPSQAASSTLATSNPVPAAPPRPVPAPSQVGDENAPAASAGSIVAQIDSILQARIAGTPLGEKGIRLQDSPDGGVLVWVGIDKFQGVEEVPDEQIRAAIRAAIAQWEGNYTPGA